MSKVDCRGWIRRMQASRPVIILSPARVIRALSHPPGRRLRRIVMGHRIARVLVGSLALAGMIVLGMRIWRAWP